MKEGDFMSYLTKEDEQRFLNLFPSNGMIMSYISKELVSVKGTRKELEEKTKKQVNEIFDTLGAPTILKGCNPTISFVKEKGLCYDPNIILSTICSSVYTHIFNKNGVTHYKIPDLGRLYYCGKKEEYINSMRAVLTDIKNQINYYLNHDPYLDIIDQSGEKRNYIVESRKIINWFIRNLESFMDGYEVTLNDDIKSYFSQDKLIIFLGHLSVSEIAETLKLREDVEVNNAYVHCLQAVVSYIIYRRKEDENYNPSYNYTDETGNSYFISADAILIQNKEFANCVSGYPKEPLTEEELLDILSDLKRKIRLEEFRKTISIGWEFLPEKENKANTGRKIERKNDLKTEEELTQEEKKKERLLEEKTSLFSSLPYIANLKGKDHFEGYEAYVFENGKVILEKFYKKTRDGYVPTMNEAIYAMNIKDFEELSKMGKTEVREYAKANGLDLTPIYHTKYFSKRVMSIVNSKSYNSDVLDYIDQLIEKSKSPLEKRI